MSPTDSRPLTRDLAPFGVRIPPDLKTRIQSAAEANNRSMNAEIVATLEEKYPAPVEPSSIQFATAFEAIERIKRSGSDEEAQLTLDEINELLSIMRSKVRVVIARPERNADGSRNVQVINIVEDRETPW